MTAPAQPEAVITRAGRPRDLWGFRHDQHWVYWMFGGMLGLSLLLPLDTVVEGPVICTFRRMFDLPCPGCGLTRAFVATGHGQFEAAFGFHMFGTFLWSVLWVALLGRALQRWLGWEHVVFPRGVWKSWFGKVFLVSWAIWAVWRVVDACVG